MSNTSSRYVPKLNDRDVIRAFESVVSRIDGLSIIFTDAFGQVQGDEIEQYKKLHGNSLRAATLRHGNSNWQWLRLQAESNDSSSATHDKVAFSWNAQAGQPDRVLVATVTAALDTALLRPLNAAKGGSPTISDTDYMASQAEILLSLEGAVSQVLTDTTNHRNTLDLAYAEKERMLLTHIEEQRERELDRISEERSRVDAELTARKAALDETNAALEAHQKTLDDRNNTHVRREIRSSLLELAKERLSNFGVSKETRTQYVAVHLVSLVGLLFLGSSALMYGSLISANEAGITSPAAIAVALKAALMAAAAVALGAWYLRWLNRWLQRIADAEFKLQQFRLDIERASWLAETVLEWKATSPEPFPELLASRLSMGLFHSSSAETDDPKTPASHLAEALFGAASSAKIKLGNQEVAFDRKAIRRLEDE